MLVCVVTGMSNIEAVAGSKKNIVVSSSWSLWATAPREMQRKVNRNK